MEERSNNYDELINNLELENLFFLEASAKREEDFSPPANIKITRKQEYKNEGNKIKVYVNYLLKAIKKGSKEPGFSLSVKYLVIYKSKIQMANDSFEKFSKTSLLVEIWPYFREYVHETTMRLGLPPLILNLLKRKQSSRKKKSSKN